MGNADRKFCGNTIEKRDIKSKFGGASTTGFLGEKNKRQGKSRILEKVDKKISEKKSKKISLTEKWKNVDPLKLSATQIWKMIFEEKFGDVPYLTGKESGQLKQAQRKYPAEYRELVELVLGGWGNFTYRSQIDAGAFNMPKNPHTGFFCKFLMLPHMNRENSVEGRFCASDNENNSSKDRKGLLIPKFLEGI